VSGNFLSIIIPAYNEEHRILPVLTSIIEYFSKKDMSFEVLVVSDGSTDATSTVVVNTFSGDTPIRVLAYPDNKGKGFAVRHGALYAQGQYVLIADADGATPVEEFEKLLAVMREGYDVAVGSRALNTGSVELKARRHRIILGRVFNFFVNILCVPGIRDTQCGFKLFTRTAADMLFKRQSIDGFAFDCELLHIAHVHSLQIKEVAVNWYNVEGSKVNLMTDPLYMFLELLKIRYRSLTGRYT
jgi:dolichyl-phosphate beta-glucosyltransferase